MAIINCLNINFVNEKIDSEYDFYMFVSTEKFIKNGTYILDELGDKIKIESLVFDSGNKFYIMLKRGAISKYSLVSIIENENIILKKICSINLSDDILFKLFLYSINNFECDNLKFNNITGKLFIFSPDWIKKNRNTFKALKVNVDKNMNIIASAVGFSKYSLFKSKKYIKDIKKLPKYIFSYKNNTLKRTFNIKDYDDSYIAKSLYGKKAEIQYFNLSKKELKNNKVYYVYKTLDILKEKYLGLFSFELVEVPIIKSQTKSRDTEFMDKALKDFNSRDTNIINKVLGSEYTSNFLDLVDIFKSRLKSKISISNEIDNKKNNIIFIHNQEFYKVHKYKDPYKSLKRNALVQCVTVEDSVDKIIKDNDAIFNSIIKEVVIKQDILNKFQFSLDDWSSFNFNYNLIFGKESDGKLYYMVVKPNGTFKFESKLNDFTKFKNELLNKCSYYLTLNNIKDSIIIADSTGNINLISKTNKTVYPSKELFDLEVISRSKESRIKYLSGVVDINLFNFNDGKYYFNTGIKGAGMNTAIPKAPLIYKNEIIVGKNIFENILDTMSVNFVKYKYFTVLPYPIKYLNECILLNKK